MSNSPQILRRSRTCAQRIMLFSAATPATIPPMHARYIMLLCLALILAGCRRQAPATSQPSVRVVSLAPSITEILFLIGAGDLVVGRTTACDYPPEASGVPVVGDFGAPSLERLLAVRPTLVIEVDLADETTGQKIDSIGLTRRRIPCSRLEDIPNAIAAVGRLVGRESAAEALAAGLRIELENARQQSATAVQKPSVFVEVWHDPLTTAGSQSFVSEIVTLAGGSNLGDEVQTPYYQVSPEWVIGRNPDIIVGLYMSGSAGITNLVHSRPGWSELTAVKSGHIYGNLRNDVVLRPGPRVMEGIDELRRCLAPSSIIP